MAKASNASTKSSGATKGAGKTRKSSNGGKSAKAGGASAKPQSQKLVEYVGQAAGKERHIEAALAAHLVMTTRPAYHGRLEQHLRATKLRAEKLEGRMKDLGGSTRSISAASPAMGDVKDAAKMVTDRAVSLAKGPVDEMRDDHEAETLLEHARIEYSDACEQIGTYRVVHALAKAADDKKTQKLAKDFRDEHDDMAEYVQKLIPKLSAAVVKTEERGRAKSGSGGSGSSGSGRSGSRQSSNGGARRSSSSASTGSRGRSSTAKSGRSRSTASSSGSGSKSGSTSRGTRSRGGGSGGSGSGKRSTAASKS